MKDTCDHAIFISNLITFCIIFDKVDGSSDHYLS